jgi:hypothetical protein
MTVALCNAIEIAGGNRPRKRRYCYVRPISFEQYVLGMLNGLTIGADLEVWNADGRTISWDAVYFWIDGYCRSHPTDLLNSAVVTFFKERSGVQ